MINDKSDKNDISNDKNDKNDIINDKIRDD